MASASLDGANTLRTMESSDEAWSRCIETLVSLGDEDLSAAIYELSAERTRRALGRGDLDAVVELGFEEGFSPRGVALDPWVASGLVICPGSLVEKSATSHDCRFANVDGTWVWESDVTLVDVVRRVGSGARTSQRSISLLEAVDGLSFDVIEAKKSQGQHRMTRVRSYCVRDGQLQLVATRAPKVGDFR